MVSVVAKRVMAAADIATATVNLMIRNSNEYGSVSEFQYGIGGILGLHYATTGPPL